MKNYQKVANLSIALCAPEIIPTFLTEKFLKESTIIPRNWNFLEKPDIGSEESFVVFTNGLKISSNPGIVILSQEDSPNSSVDIVPQIATKWVSVLKDLSYQSVGIKPYNFYTNDSPSKPGVKYFIFNNLVTANPLNKFSKEPIVAELNLIMSSERGQFSILFEDILLQNTNRNGEMTEGIIIRSNFEYDLAEVSRANRKAVAIQKINNWRLDWELFQQITSQIISLS
jgi:hypothetical protein